MLSRLKLLKNHRANLLRIIDSMDAQMRKLQDDQAAIAIMAGVVSGKIKEEEQRG